MIQLEDRFGEISISLRCIFDTYTYTDVTQVDKYHKYLNCNSSA